MFPVTIAGNLTRDPEIRTTNSGTMVSKFSVATSKRIRDKESGEWGNGPASYWDCIAWGDLGEQIVENFQKGTPVILYGEQEQRKYTAQDGTEKTAIEVTVRNIGADLSRAKRQDRSRQQSRPSFDPDSVPF